MSLICSLSDVFSRAGLDHEVSAKPGGAVFYGPDRDSIFSYRMRVYPSDGAALLESFTVGEKYRGNGQKIGGTAIRHMAAHLEREGVDTLGLFRVQDDGLTFWPTLGALPNNCGPLGMVMKHIHSGLPEGHDDRGKTAEALRRVAQNPEKTWFEMTDPESDIGLSRPTLRRLSQVMLAQQTYVFEFDRPEVRSRLALG